MTREFAGIETGGTKIVARLVDDNGAVLASGRWATTSPAAAADDLVRFVEGAIPEGMQLAGVGIAAFGPLLLDPASPEFGRMLHTPKPGWSGSNLRAALFGRLRVPVAIDTDVNAAALAEQRLGAGRGLASLAYVTVGTGIGGGFVIDGRSLIGAGHSEVGHIRLIRLRHDRAPSACPFMMTAPRVWQRGPRLRGGWGGIAPWRMHLTYLPWWLAISVSSPRPWSSRGRHIGSRGEAGQWRRLGFWTGSARRCANPWPATARRWRRPSRISAPRQRWPTRDSRERFCSLGKAWKPVMSDRHAENTCWFASKRQS